MYFFILGDNKEIIDSLLCFYERLVKVPIPEDIIFELIKKIKIVKFEANSKLKDAVTSYTNILDVLLLANNDRLRLINKKENEMIPAIVICTTIVSLEYLKLSYQQNIYNNSI